MPTRFLLLDYDSKFPEEFDAVFESEGTEVKRAGPVAANLNAYAERRVRSAKVGRLDQFLISGEGQLRHVITEYAARHNQKCPHQSRKTVPLPVAQVEGSGSQPVVPIASGRVKCRYQLRGLLGVTAAPRSDAAHRR